jgi:hypothetical protein
MGLFTLVSIPYQRDAGDVQLVRRRQELEWIINVDASVGPPARYGRARHLSLMGATVGCRRGELSARAVHDR